MQITNFQKKFQGPFGPEKFQGPLFCHEYYASTPKTMQTQVLLEKKHFSSLPSSHKDQQF